MLYKSEVRINYLNCSVKNAVKGLLVRPVLTSKKVFFCGENNRIDLVPMEKETMHKNFIGWICATPQLYP